MKIERTDDVYSYHAEDLAFKTKDATSIRQKFGFWSIMYRDDQYTTHQTQHFNQSRDIAWRHKNMESESGH